MNSNFIDCSKPFASYNGYVPHNPFSSPIYVNECDPPQQGSLEKLVHWYNDQFHLPASAKKIAFVATAALACIASAGLLLPLAFRIHDIHQQQQIAKAQATFQEEIQLHIQSGSVVPPELDPVVLKTSTRTFNHVNEYAIESSILWYRRRGTQEWRPLFFDGSLTHTIPKEISADGANLIVIDTENKIHYRKVLDETSSSLLAAKRRFIREHAKNATQLQTAYFATDITQSPVWTTSWFSMPVIGTIANLFTGKLLSAKNAAASHRGTFAPAFADARGHVHRTGIGVTTVYELEQGNHSIRLHDPWLPRWSPVRLILPETQNKVFVAQRLDSSAGALLCVGYSIDERTKTGHLKILTNLFDFDLAGHNPGIMTSYESNHQESERKRSFLRKILPQFVLKIWPELSADLVRPDIVKKEGWKEHPFPKDAIELYDQIAIVATGSTDSDREIRIAGMNVAGRRGYFYKKIYDQEWQFEESATVAAQNPLQRVVENMDLPKVVRCGHRYTAHSHNPACEKTQQVCLSGFRPGYSAHPTLTVEFQSRTYTLHYISDMEV